MASKWINTTVGEQATLQRGIDITRATQRDGRVPVISSGGINSYHDQAIVKGPGVVLGRKGVVGSVYYVESDYWPHDTTLWVKDFHGNYPRFVYYFFVGITKYISRLDVGSANPTLNRNHLHPMEIVWPEDTDEQKVIAEILGTLDDRIELNQKMNETLEAMARALFKSWFVDFDPVRAKAGKRDTGLPESIAALFPDSFEDSEVGKIPKGWGASSLGQIADVIDCLHAKKPERLPEGLPLLQLGNIRADALLDMSDTYLISEADYGKWISRMEASPGDCVITNVGRVGAISQIPDGFNAALGRNMTGVRCHSTFPFPTFLIQALTSDFMRAEIEQNTDSGTILDALNVRSIPKLRIVIPPPPVLKHFERLCRPFRQRMEIGVKETRSLTALRDLLLPKLISGEIRPGQEKERA